MGHGATAMGGISGPVRCWRPLLSHPPTEGTAALTGHCTSVVSSPLPAPREGGAPLLLFGIKDLRILEATEVPGIPELVREGLLCKGGSSAGPWAAGVTALVRGTRVGTAVTPTIGYQGPERAGASLPAPGGKHPVACPSWEVLI